MKSNMPKRKIFDAVDLLTEEFLAQITEGGMAEIPVSAISVFL